MERGLHRLTAKQVEAAKAGTTLNDGGGLFLRVSPKGSARWVFRFKLPGARQREMGLGTFGAGGVTLALARRKAAEARQQVALGLDPIAEGEKEAEAARAAQEAEARAMTFGAYADDYVPEKVKQFTNPKHIYQWEFTFSDHAAALRDKKLAEITRKDILDVLRPIWDAKHVTASRVRGRLENLFDYAIQNGDYAHDNPARWSLFSATLSAPRRQEGKGHQPAMPRAEIPAFIRKARERQADSVAALALEFVVLTTCRSGEARLARWSEFDMDRLVWTVPKERMKMRRPHAVPLTPRMVEILSGARTLCGGAPAPSDLVFPSPREGEPLSDMALLMALRRLGAGRYTVHGFRSAFRDWAGNETEFSRELAEEALAHALGGVERAYRREQAVERRRVMMQAWEDFVTGEASRKGDTTVVPFPGRTAGGAQA